MNLVIVESPAKAKTIQKYLGPGFIVKSSYGHIRDLPKSTLGVDTANGFAPHYVVPAAARSHVADLKKAALNAETVYFATDEDREGEAIAWHLAEILKADPAKIQRITFDEITKTAITHAIAHPRGLDLALVNAQQARRILDRLVGYELSPLLWHKVRRGLSAGRVQSVAVRLIVEREEEISAFKAEEYWSITAELTHNGLPFTAGLFARGETKIPKLGVKSAAEADAIVRDVTGLPFIVKNVVAKERHRTPPPPFTTSTLQQAAVNQLNYSSKKTMVLAQQLYEGVDLGDEGPTGLITYMRTDSTHIAAEASAAARTVIIGEFGPDYALAQPRVFAAKSKGAQEAHEAIRPTDPARSPDKLSSHLAPDQLRLYRLIWQRFMASQMAEAKLKQVSVDLFAGACTFRATGSSVLFDGYAKVLGEKAAFKETLLPDLKTGDTPRTEKIVPEQHFTEPLARYSEATLVKALEEHGIGRPSTYAPTIDTVQRRGYVEKGDDKRFRPTEIGTLITKLLREHFPNIVDLKFTAKMEDDLDLIAAGKEEWEPVLRAFYDPFHKSIGQKEKELSRAELTQEKTGETCPDCGSELVIKLGRFGKFKACTNFPKCKHTEPVGVEKEVQDQASGEMCPKCGKPVVVKRGRFGMFFGCAGYPDCDYIKKIQKSTGVKCPACGTGDIVEKKTRRGKTFYACNRYPECKTAFWSKPTGEHCPECGQMLILGAKNTVRCSSKECKFKKEAEPESTTPPAAE